MLIFGENKEKLKVTLNANPLHSSDNLTQELFMGVLIQYRYCQGKTRWNTYVLTHL